MAGSWRRITDAQMLKSTVKSENMRLTARHSALICAAATTTHPGPAHNQETCHYIIIIILSSISIGVITVLFLFRGCCFELLSGKESCDTPQAGIIDTEDCNV